MNKKGSLDNMAIPVLLFIIAAGIMVSYLILQVGQTAFSSDATSLSLVNNGMTMVSRIGNNGFMFIAAALIIFNMVGAFLLLTHPIFVIIDLFMMPFSIIIAAVMSNAYESSLYTMSVASVFPGMSFIMLHLPIIIVLADFLSAIAGYAFYKQ